MNLATAISHSKTKFIFLIILLFPSFISNAQFWEKVPNPDTAWVNCLTINQNGTILIGTVEDTFEGGIYRSTDNGISWSFSGLTYYGTTVYSIFFKDDNTAFAGTGWKLYRSTNEGNNWVEVLTCDGNVLSIFQSKNRSTDNGDFWENILSPGNETGFFDFTETSNGYLYACTWDFQNYLQNGVYRSKDGGYTWVFIDIADDGFTSLAINSNDEIFAGSYYEGLYRSSDYGET
jgi:hypothetical protein